MKDLWRGRSSWVSLITIKNVILGTLTMGIWLIVPILRVLSGRYEIKSDRVVFTRGLLSKKVEQVDLVRYKDIQFQQSILGRLLSFGDITLVTSDVTQKELKLLGVRNPETVYEIIREAAEERKRVKGVRTQEFI